MTTASYSGDTHDNIPNSRSRDLGQQCDRSQLVLKFRRSNQSGRQERLLAIGREKLSPMVGGVCTQEVGGEW